MLSKKVATRKQKSLQEGKIQPQALELEDAVLGAMMIDKEALHKGLVILTSDCFYSPKNDFVFKAVKQLYNANEPVDLLTISNQLKKDDSLDSAGGDMRLIQLTQKVSSSAHIEYHARIIMQKYILRELIKVSGKIIQEAYKDIDVFDVLDFAGQQLDKVNSIIESESTSQTWADAMISLPERVEFLSKNKGEITGLPTGLNALDKHFSGWQPTDFIVIGGDSGMGKTALSMTFILACAKQNKAVGMFSMEMSVMQLGIRGMAVESDFHMNQLMRTGFEKPQYFIKLNEYVNVMKNYPIYVDDKPALTVAEMKRKARALKRKHNIQLLIVDFLQMFSGDKDIRINVGDAARECKNLAKELNIAVIALSQISREVRKSKYFIPRKYHLKEASSIEEAADIIGMIYRPEYYGYDRASHLDLYNDILGIGADSNAVLIVEKNRNGSLGNVALSYVDNKTKFVNDTTPY